MILLINISQEKRYLEVWKHFRYHQNTCKLLLSLAPAAAHHFQIMVELCDPTGLFQP